MNLNTRRLLAICGAVAAPLPAYVAVLIVLTWLQKTIDAPHGTAAQQALALAFIASSILGALVGLLFLPMAFGRHSLWLGLLYVPAMAIIVRIFWDGVIGSIIGRTDVW